MSNAENFKTAYLSFKSWQCKSMVYTWYIPDIYMVYAIHIPELVLFLFRQLSNKQWMLEEVQMHVHSMALQYTNAIVLKSHVLLQDRIYQVYTRYILSIYRAKVTCEPSQLPIRAWKPQTGTSVGSSQFWPQRGRPREAGAVQSSTTRC